jgi:hypothetical protein
MAYNNPVVKQNWRKKMEWQFADVFSDANGAEVHFYELVDTETGVVLDEKYVTQEE